MQKRGPFNDLFAFREVGRLSGQNSNLRSYFRFAGHTTAINKRASQTRESFSAAAGILIALRTWLDSISPQAAESRTHSRSPTQSGL
jgi:hypothetical protein